MIQLGELAMIFGSSPAGLSVSAIARRIGIDRKTVRKYIERGLEPPHYGPRQPRARRLEPFEVYLRQRAAAYPGLTGSRLLREIRKRGYEGGYTAVTDFLREVRPAPVPPFEALRDAAGRTGAGGILPSSKSSLPTSPTRCARSGYSR